MATARIRSPQSPLQSPSPDKTDSTKAVSATGNGQAAALLGVHAAPIRWSLQRLQRSVGNGAFASAHDTPAAQDPEGIRAAALKATSGPSGPLPYLDQIRKSFGSHDVSSVSAHVDAVAATQSLAAGAAALTIGEHVAFAGTPSLAVAAHEAAHVLQQRAGVQVFGGVGHEGDQYERHADAVAERVVQGRSAGDLLPPVRAFADSSPPGSVVQRQIVIGDDPYVPTDEDWKEFDNELLQKLHNEGKPPEYRFKDHDEFRKMMLMRKSVVETMLNEVSEGMGISSDEDFSLPPEWQATQKGFVIKRGTTPAAAVRSIFGSGKKLVRLDCNSMMVAVQYKGMLDAFGDDKFNEMFPGGAGLVISQTDTLDETVPPHPFVAKKAYTEHVSGSSEMRIVIDPKDPTKELLPGDWVYFANIAEYKRMTARLANMIDNIWETLPKNTDPKLPPEYRTNFWQGEHAVYVGHENFTGLGFDKPVTYDEMMNTLLQKYEKVVQAYCRWPYRKYADDSSESDCMAEWKAKAAGQEPQLARVLRLDYSKLSELSK